MGQGNIYRRRVKVFTLAIKIYLDYKALQQREKWINHSKRAALWDRAHDRNAKRVLNAIIELEGLWVKLGQYLSTRVDVLPQAYISQLKQLQDSLPPRPLEEVCQCIKKELGKSIDELFSYFDKNPLASASIAQVHRATLANGQDVVVKVQHEGITTVILEDLKNAKSLVDWIAWAEPQYDFHPILDEWCKEAPKELDFNNEAENTRTVARNLQCNKKHDDSNLVSTNKVDVLIPEVIQSTEKVLILEYMDGVRLNDLDSLEACGANKQKIVEEITRAYAHQIFVDGFFNGDPHPGNFLVSKDPPHRPILLDFGLTKKLPTSMKQALAKMFLASAEGDHVALLSALAEMGLKLRLDMPEKAMEVAKVFFRASTPASEALDNIKSLAEQRAKNIKTRQEKTKVDEKVKQFNLVEAFPGELLIFTRVVNLLRGLSSTMNVRIVYQEIMRPFAEYVLQGCIDKGPETNAQWIYDTPAHSEVERKLRKLLFELGDDKKILGIQVCAYKDGEVVIDTAAGVLGKYDPRPVQPDSLFPVFSVTKGITAGMLHWLVDNGKLKLDENVDNIWLGFGANRKHIIRVHHVLNHTSGLHNALANLIEENPLLLCNWDECLDWIAKAEPETEPGQQQLYHYMSYGWLCGGIIEHASGKKFQEILEEGIVKPLNIEGEMYIGIPPGVESRLATLTLDKNDLSRLSEMDNLPELPSSFQLANIAQMATALPVVFNMLPVRRAIIPAANGHCSARALGRYFAALVDGGMIPPPHSSSSKPLLGSHAHIPKFPSQKPSKKWKKSRQVSGCLKIQSNDDDNKLKCSRESNDVGESGNDVCTRVVGNGSTSRGNCKSKNVTRIFTNPGIHDEFFGVGEYKNLALPHGKFGLGFRRFRSTDGSITGFGHLGMDGSAGFCDVKNRFAIAVTLNKMSFGDVTRKIIQLVCSELNVPVPEDYSGEGELGWQYNIGRPLIN